MTVPQPGSNIRRYYTPSGAYLGFDNYGGQQPSLYGGEVEIPKMETPSPTEMLQRQYAPQPTTENFMADMQGTGAVGLKNRKLINDQRWLALRQTNPQKADEIYSQTYGVSPDEDAYADQQGFTTLQQLRQARMAPQMADQYRKQLSGFEAQHGFNANLVARDLDRGADPNQGFFSGYDPQAHGVWQPQYGNGGEQMKSRFSPVEDYVAQNTRRNFQQLYGGARQAQPQAEFQGPQQPQQTTAMPEAMDARRMRLQQLQQKRQALDPETAQSVLSGEYSGWQPWSGAMY